MKKGGSSSNNTTLATTTLPSVAKPAARRANAASAPSSSAPTAAANTAKGKQTQAGAAQQKPVKLPSIASPAANKAKSNSKAAAEAAKASTSAGSEGQALSAETESQSTPSPLPPAAAEEAQVIPDALSAVTAAEPPQTSHNPNPAQPSESSATAPAAEQPAVAVAAAAVKNGNGTVKLIYEQYDESFPIADGSTTQEQIDEVYCLSFVMPGCALRLSALSPAEKRRAEEKTPPPADIYVPEHPAGVFHDLEAGGVYYVYVEQEAERLARDQEMMRRVAASMEGAARPADKLSFDDGRAMESCSCIYGNPCVDEYGCKDWSNRFAVATKNGWKGF